MKSLLAFFVFMSFSTSVSALVVKSQDKSNKCTLYRVTREASPKAINETVIADKESYGLSLINLDIDFNNREASVDLIANIVMGFNKNVVGTKVKIQENHPDFKLMVNFLNRKINLLEKACIDRNNNIVYVSQFELN